MKFSCMIWPHSGTGIAPVVQLARVAEECGFETVYVGDSQMIWNDVWVILGACAVATSRVRLGPGVTNAVTRHPAVTANAINSLNLLSGGRAVLGIGAGDSAVRTAGLSPAKMAPLQERIEFIRALLDGQEVDALEWGVDRREGTWGQEQKVRCLGTEDGGADIAIELACMGPVSLMAGGAVCDGVIVDGHLGGNAEGARFTVKVASEAARAAGRDLSTYRFIAAIDAAIDEDRAVALDKVRPTVARNVANKPWLPDTIKVDHAQTVKDVTESYKFYQHLDLTAQHRKLIPDELAMKCAIAGTPQDCIEKAHELREAGITEISIFITSQDENGSATTLRRFAEEVLPHV